jgi:MerR family transcriptional regulator, mercuric resistance operon regulatory protein
MVWIWRGDGGMRIGELANRARVHVQTVRFYERRGLLRKPSRTLSRYRDYTPTDVETVVFIKWCQPLGFTLKEVKQLLQLHTTLTYLPAARIRRKSKELSSIVHMAEEKLASIEEKINSLRTMKKQVRSTIDELQGRQGPVCPASKRITSSSRRNLHS